MLNHALEDELRLPRPRAVTATITLWVTRAAAAFLIVAAIAMPFLPGKKHRDGDPPRRTDLVYVVVLGAFAAGLAWWSETERVVQARLLRDGEFATARISDVGSWRVSYSFQDAGGATHQSYFSLGRRELRLFWQNAGPLTVAYDPANPSVNRIYRRISFARLGY